jgi:hypothetical protein
MRQEAYLTGCSAHADADEVEEVRGDGRSEASRPEWRRLVRAEADEEAEQRGRGDCRRLMWAVRELSWETGFLWAGMWA